MAKKVIILGKIPTLVEECNSLLKEELLLKDKWEIVKMKKICEEHVKDLSSLRDELLKKYGIPSEDGTQYSFSKENLPLFQKEIGDLIQKEIEITSELNFTELEKIKSTAHYEVIFDLK